MSGQFAVANSTGALSGLRRHCAQAGLAREVELNRESSWRELLLGNVFARFMMGIVLPIVLGLTATISSGCAGWRHGYSTAYYQGAVMDVEGPGGDRLEIEKGYDRTVREYVEQWGRPDFVYVPDALTLQLVYVSRDVLVSFHRSALSSRSEFLEVPVPPSLLELLIASGIDVTSMRRP